LSIVATPPLVASWYFVEQGGDQAVQRRGVRHDVRLDVEFAAGKHDRDAVVTDRAGHDDGIARLGVSDPEAYVPGDNPHPGGVDVASVGLAPLHDLRVPGDDVDACRGGGLPHGRGDPGQVGDGKALLQDEPGRQV
jgi:hypothetical protein